MSDLVSKLLGTYMIVSHGTKHYSHTDSVTVISEIEEMDFDSPPMRLTEIHSEALI